MMHVTELDYVLLQCIIRSKLGKNGNIDSV